MKETSLFDSLLEELQKPSGPVTCLGMSFENDEARRAYFTEELRKGNRSPPSSRQRHGRQGGSLQPFAPRRDHLMQVAQR